MVTGKPRELRIPDMQRNHLGYQIQFRIETIVSHSLILHRAVHRFSGATVVCAKRRVGHLSGRLSIRENTLWAAFYGRKTIRLLQVPGWGLQCKSTAQEDYSA
jgi:hypothetical protein